MYWGLTTLSIMGHPDALDREEMIYFVMSCWQVRLHTFVPEQEALMLIPS